MISWMIVSAIKTDRIKAGQQTIFSVLDKYLPELQEGSVVAITSKIVSLCENNVVPQDSTDLLDQIKNQSEYYLEEAGQYGQRLTITHRILVSKSGIDNSIGNLNYILLPKDPQDTANKIREHIASKTGLNKLGVVITDSISIPFKYGAIGIALSFSGFEPINETPQSKANIACGLAATAVLAMGEGAQQTPLAIISDASMVKFVNRDPNPDELQKMNISLEDDFFAPILHQLDWQKGLGKNS